MELATRIPNHPRTCAGVSSPTWDQDSVKQCRLCWLAPYDERYRALWGLTDGGKSLASSQWCGHRGEVVGNLRPDQAGCKCQHGPSVYKCGATGNLAVLLEPDWTGVKADGPVRVPPPFIRWRGSQPVEWPTIQSCVGCVLRDVPKQVEPHRFTRWAVGITTAPRRVSRLTETIASVKAAGFSAPMVFGEPESERPEGTWSENATERLGVVRNWRRALQRLLVGNPEADAIAIFQDDCVLASDTKAWLESLAVPTDAAFVSVYCPTTYSPYNCDQIGALLKIQGRALDAMNGAVALVFPRPMAELLAGDAIFGQLTATKNLDGHIGKWCGRIGRFPYYANPSRVWHTGDTSTIHTELLAVGHRQAATVDVVRIDRTTSEAPRIGVVGFNTASGLGTLARQAAKRLPNASFLAIRHGEFADLPRPPGVRTATCDKRDVTTQAQFAASVDVLLFFEYPHGEALQQTARSMGVPMACVVMHENTPPQGDAFLANMDLLIAPNAIAWQALADVSTTRKVRLDWPIDVAGVIFRQRRTAETFLFCQGTGGRNDRKGSLVVAKAAAMLPDIPFIVRTQLGDKRSGRKQNINWPSNVTVLGMSDSIDELYRLGDVCVQPSRYEGMGLQLLECQAAGMPLITTNAPPMSDYRPWKVVSGLGMTVRLGRAFEAIDVAPEDLAATIRQAHGHDIRAASTAAGEFVRSSYSWEKLGEDITSMLAGLAGVVR